MKALFLVLASVTAFGAGATPVKSPEVLKAACHYLASWYPENSLDRGFEDWGIEIYNSAACKDLRSNVVDATQEKVGSKTYITGLRMTFKMDGFTCKLKANRSVKVTLDRHDNPIVSLSDWFVDSDIKDSQGCRIDAEPFMETFEFSKTSPNVRRATEKEQAKLDFKNVPDTTDLAPDDGTYGSYDWDYLVFNNSGKQVGYVRYIHYYNSEMESGSGFILKFNMDQKFIGYLFKEDQNDYLEFCEFLEGNLQDEGYQQSYNENCK